MLTRLEIQGFRNLLDVDLRLGPVTVLVGRNGAGKSNLLAALRFLSLLARVPIADAISGLRRGTPLTVLEGWTAPELRLAAELFVEREVRDALGVAATASTSTLRYEVVLRRTEGGEALALASERLLPIRHTEAHRATLPWASRALRDSCLTGRRAQPLISTEGGYVRVHHDGLSARRVRASGSPATVLCAAASAEYPTLLAARRALESISHLALPEAGAPRLAALASLSGGAERGTFCLEEPAGGLHPERIPELAALLRGASVDPSAAVDARNPLRQVVCTTHSPMLVEALVRRDELVYLDLVSARRDGARGEVVVPRYPPGSWRLAAASPEDELDPWKLSPYLRHARTPEQLELPTKQS